MTSDQRDIRRKLRVLKHAEAHGSVVKTCRYFGIGRAIMRKICCAFNPLDISLRSRSDKTNRDLLRTGGRMPPVRDSSG